MFLSEEQENTWILGAFLSWCLYSILAACQNRSYFLNSWMSSHDIRLKSSDTMWMFESITIEIVFRFWLTKWTCSFSFAFFHVVFNKVRNKKNNQHKSSSKKPQFLFPKSRHLGLTLTILQVKVLLPSQKCGILKDLKLQHLSAHQVLLCEVASAKKHFIITVLHYQVIQTEYQH